MALEFVTLTYDPPPAAQPTIDFPYGHYLVHLEAHGTCSVVVDTAAPLRPLPPGVSVVPPAPPKPITVKPVARPTPKPAKPAATEKE